MGGGGEFPLGESCRRQWRTFLERGSSRGREQQISDENGVHRETLKGDERKKKKEKKEEGAERTRVLLASPFFLEEFVSFVFVVLGWRIIHWGKVGQRGTSTIRFRDGATVWRTSATRLENNRDDDHAWRMLPLVLAARRFFEASPLARGRLSKGCLIAKGLQREGLTVWRFVRVESFVIVIFRRGESWMRCYSNLWVRRVV